MREISLDYRGGYRNCDSGPTRGPIKGSRAGPYLSSGSDSASYIIILPRQSRECQRTDGRTCRWIVKIPHLDTTEARRLFHRPKSRSKWTESAVWTISDVDDREINSSTLSVAGIVVSSRRIRPRRNTRVFQQDGMDIFVYVVRKDDGQG